MNWIIINCKVSKAAKVPGEFLRNLIANKNVKPKDKSFRSV